MSKQNNFFQCHPGRPGEAVYINIAHIVAVKQHSVVMDTDTPGIKEMFLSDYELKELKRLLGISPKSYSI